MYAGILLCVGSLFAPSLNVLQVNRIATRLQTILTYYIAVHAYALMTALPATDLPQPFLQPSLRLSTTPDHALEGRDIAHHKPQRAA